MRFSLQFLNHLATSIGRSRITCPALLIFILLLGANSKALGQNKPDTQGWFEIQISHPLDKKKDWTATVIFTGRLGNGAETVTDARAGFNVTRRINKIFSAGGGYLYRYSNTTFRRVGYEHRFLLFANANIPIGNKIFVTAREMAQYEDRLSRQNDLIFRTKAGLKRVFDVRKLKLEMYATAEQFYSVHRDQPYRYQERLGIVHPFNKHAAIDIFYVRQDDLGTRPPPSVNGIGTTLRFTL